MRFVMRGLRRGMALLFILGVAAGVVYYFFFTLSGIVRQVERRQVLSERYEYIAETATAIAPTVQAESLELASFERQLVTPAASPTTDLSMFVVTDEPTFTPEIVTEIAQVIATTEAPASPTPTLRDTATSEPTATRTPRPSRTPLPTDTPTSTATDTAQPSETPTEVPTEVGQVATLPPTNTLRPTLPPTNTLRPSPTASPTNTDTPTATFTPSLTFTPSPTETPTATFTPSLTLTPSLTPSPTLTPYPIEGTYATPVVTPITEINTRAPLVEDDPNIVNIILLGSDTRGGGVGQTDVIILVTVNKELGTVAMWHLPRDLLVYIPGYTIDRINRAYAVGIESQFPGGGAGLMKETILYNLGIEVDFFARVDFSDFQRIIEELGGLDISIDCQLEDWALISPELDPTIEENYERYTLRIGRQTLDPYYALWYVRSRVSTNDLDRGRRQIDVLRAIFAQSRDLGIFTQVTELWPEAAEIIETDMELSDVLDFLPVASTLDISNIERFNGVMNVHFTNYTTPDDGRSVLLPNWPALYELARNFVTPPTGNRLNRSAVSIEIADGSAYGIGFDLVAADRLAWEGFRVVPIGQIGGSIRETTIIYDYTGETNNSRIQDIMDVMRVGPSSVVFDPQPDSPYDFRIEVGRSYNSCIYGSSADEPPVEAEIPSEPTPTPDPNVTPETVG